MARGKPRQDAPAPPCPHCKDRRRVLLIYPAASRTPPFSYVATCPYCCSQVVMLEQTPAPWEELEEIRLKRIVINPAVVPE